MSQTIKIYQKLELYTNPITQATPSTREHPKTYSDVIKTGLQAKHSHMDVVAFEAIWLKAKRPPILNDNFPYRIEGMTPSIWHTMYKKESNRYHKFSVSCLLCNKVDKIINKIFKCHRSVLSSECSNCQTKSKNAPYLNRTLLANIHSKNLNL